MQLAATPAAPVAAVQMAAGGDDRIVLGVIVKAWESNQAEEKNRNGLLLVVWQMESSS